MPPHPDGAVSPAELVTPYGPGDLQSAYGLGRASQLRGNGRTIAIIDAHDDPNAEADLNVVPHALPHQAVHDR